MPHATALPKTDPLTLTSMPPMSTPLHPARMSQFPQGNPWTLGHPDPLSPSTPPPTLITLDPPLPENPLLLDEPQGLLQAMWANPLAAGL
ncbi:hypothetical protein C0989_003180 [Termitomyces sp. Mn162]|nr:hypothetical protein C0989_003180 [Termitomyces sp. Mn162]